MISGCTAVAARRRLVERGEEPAGAVTWNPADKNDFLELLASNLRARNSSTGNLGQVRANHGRSTGKFILSFGFWLYSSGGFDARIGLANASYDLDADTPGSATGRSVVINQAGTVRAGGVDTTGVVGAITAFDVLDMAVDLTADKLWFRLNGGNWNNDAGADPAAGTGALAIALPSGVLFPFCASNNPDKGIVSNFSYPTVYSNPAGFVGWNGATS